MTARVILQPLLRRGLGRLRSLGRLLLPAAASWPVPVWPWGHFTVKAQEKKSGRRSGRDTRQEGTATPHSHCAAGSTGLAAHGAALHGLPALRVGMSHGRASALYRLENPDAAGVVLRAGLLPSRMYEMLGGVPCRSDIEDYASRQVGHPDRPRRVDKGKLHPADRRGGMRQLCPPLPHGSYPDGALRPGRWFVGEDTRGQYRTLHWLRGVRKTFVPRARSARFMWKDTSGIG